MYSYKTGLGQVWVGSKLPPNPANNIIWLRPSDDHRVLWEIRTYNIYKERWEVLTSAALTAEGLLVLIRDLEKDVKSLQELKVVLYDTVQDLTPEQQQIARQNIGAVSLEDLPPQVEVVQEVGSSTTAVMSQNAVTEELSKKASVESVTESISVHNTSSTSHADIRNLLNTCVGLPAYDSSSYKITFTTLAGASVEIDLPIEQLALRYNAETESIEFDNADGTTTSIPVSAFVKEYVGSIGDRIQISIDENNAIHATVLKNSIDWDCLSVELQERINDHVTSADFATKVVRTDIAQSLSLAAQNQALENIGADLMVIDLVNGQATLTDEQEARLLSCKGVILRGTVNAGNEVLTKIYFSDNQGGNIVSFNAIRSNRYCLRCDYTKSTKIFKFMGSFYWTNPNYVSTGFAQNFSASAQARAWSNLGLNLVVLKFPEGATSVVLTDEEDAKLRAGAAVLLTVDGTNTGVGIYNADNHIFTTIDFNTTSKSLYYSLALFSGLFHCSYDKESKIFAYHGIIRLIDSGALRFDRITSLSGAQQSQAFANLGWKVHVISESAIGSSDAVSDDEKAARLSATALLVQETGLLYNFSITSDGSRRFYGQFSNSFCTALNVNEATGVITSSSAYLYDPSAVSFDRDQSSVSDDNKNKALGNIGIDLVRIPYSLLGTTLSDEMSAVLDNARGIILVDTPNDFISPTIYNRGRTTPSSAKFITIGETKDVYYISYNKNTKALANVVHTYTDTGCVRYNQAQDLTTSQQDTALSNIGLDFVHVDYSLLGTTLTDEMFAVLDNVKGIILVNTPSNYTYARIFTKGSYSTIHCYFVGFATGTTYYEISLNKSTKLLSGVSSDLSSKFSILHNKLQSLNNTQKERALSNIGLPLVYIDYSLIGSTLDDSTYNKLLTAKGVFLENVPDGNNAPSLYFVGSSNTVTTTFVSEFNARLWFQMTLSHTLKKLSLISTSYATDVVRYGESQNLTDAQKQQARSNMGAARGQDIQNITGSAPTLSIVGGVTYVCGELTTLTVNSIEDSTDESWVYFTSGSTPTVVTWPTGANIAGDTTIVPNVSYEVCIRKSRIIIVHYEQS